MANVFAFITEEKVDGQTVNLKDNSTGWGDTYATSNVTAIAVTITDSDGNEYTYSLTSAERALFLGDDGVDLLSSDFGIGDNFPDGYYIFYILLTINIAPNSDSAYAYDGFVAEHKQRSMALAAAIEWPNYDPVKERDKMIALGYLDAAVYAAERNQYETFDYIIEKVNKIYDYYNIEEIWS